MASLTPKIYLFCGKIASGKSTLAARFGELDGCVLISEDEWLAALFVDEMKSISDYVRCSAKLRNIMSPHILSILNAGISVALDFPANTVETRRWMRELASSPNIAHELHFMDVTDETCLERLRERNAAGGHAFQASEEQFKLLSKHFEPPKEDEGFNVIRHGA